MDVVINGIDMDISGIPIPVCSCTGNPQQCYRWGCGGWQSACCTTTISIYPLPMSTKRRGARIAGRKMSLGAFKKVLEKLASEGYNFSNPIDLRTHWAKHGFVAVDSGTENRAHLRQARGQQLEKKLVVCHAPEVRVGRGFGLKSRDEIKREKFEIFHLQHCDLWDLKVELTANVKMGYKHPGPSHGPRKGGWHFINSRWFRPQNNSHGLQSSGLMPETGVKLFHSFVVLGSDGGHGV
ncbi:hypothetical protein F0562_032424 [Nyssa sinensis]|uniref:GAGA-binding transcriptional activator n=1 Tax=Nyssa sinensis TaxID=561372 RepID=A0A5J5ASN2_9ASTE|nr:hypothetical protein F0562_032424 [Nyssa sinensis]